MPSELRTIKGSGFSEEEKAIAKNTAVTVLEALDSLDVLMPLENRQKIISTLVGTALNWSNKNQEPLFLDEDMDSLKNGSLPDAVAKILRSNIESILKD